MSKRDLDGAALLRLAAELRADLQDLERVVVEAGDALAALRLRTPSNIEIYGAGKLVHDFYTASERSFQRIAPDFGGMPSGSAWHRKLLDDMALDIPTLRPAVLMADTRDALTAYLKFRHLFRNLYAFTLEWPRIAELLETMPAAHAAVRADLLGFAGFLQEIGSGG